MGDSRVWGRQSWCRWACHAQRIPSCKELESAENMVLVRAHHHPVGSRPIVRRSRPDLCPSFSLELRLGKVAWDRPGVWKELERPGAARQLDAALVLHVRADRCKQATAPKLGRCFCERGDGSQWCMTGPLVDVQHRRVLPVRRAWLEVGRRPQHCAALLGMRPLPTGE